MNLDGIPQRRFEGFTQAAIGARQTGKLVFVLIIENEDALGCLSRRIRLGRRCRTHGSAADSQGTDGRQKADQDGFSS